MNLIDKLKKSLSNYNSYSSSKYDNEYDYHENNDDFPNINYVKVYNNGKYKKPKYKNKKNTVKAAQLVYVVSSILWIFLVYHLKLCNTGAIGLLLLSVPLIVFGVNFHFLGKNIEGIEDELINVDFVSFGALIVAVLINWDKGQHNKFLFKVIMIAIILIMFSLIDVWVRKKDIIIIKHVRSALEIAALSLLGYALYFYFISGTPISIDS